MNDKLKAPRKKGGNVKSKAPEGFYTARQAQQKLGLNASTFGYYVRKERIKRYIPPMRKEGYYKREEIDELAKELALFLHVGITEEEETQAPDIPHEQRKIETRIARTEDAEGIVRVLTDMGWQTASAKQRISWYETNPYIDYVVLLGNEVMGYINAAPYVPDVMGAMLSGKMRSWDVSPSDINPYKPGKYDVYIGIATRKDVPNHTQRFGFRLISGFLSFLEGMAQQGIFIHRFYAASDQADGIKLCNDLGFVQLPIQKGDLFVRFMLDMEASDNLFAQKYREAVARSKRK